jgi:hypothetical protein
VRADLASIKRQEAREKLSKLLQEKYKVELVEPKPEPPEGAQSGAQPQDPSTPKDPNASKTP